MVWYGIGKGDVKPQKVNKEKELLQQAIERMKEFLKNPKKNRVGIQMNLDKIKTKKIPYTRKSDGKKTYLLIAEIPVRRKGQKKAEVRQYTYNKGFFVRYNPPQ